MRRAISPLLAQPPWKTRVQTPDQVSCKCRLPNNQMGKQMTIFDQSDGQNKQLCMEQQHLVWFQPEFQMLGPEKKSVDF